MMQYPNLKNLGRCDRSLRIHDHERNKRKHEDDRENNGDAIEVLLYDARAGLRGVHRRGDHVGNAGTFAGMQQNENDQAEPGDDEQGDKDEQKRIQGNATFTRINVYASSLVYPT